MRKILLSLAGLLTFGGMMAQPVSDNAVIPVAVTLNSILRLNVTTGGNIEFNVNTLQQYTSGIANSVGTTTTFTVASSLDFDVVLFAETATLVGSDLTAGAPTMALNNIGYRVATAGTGVAGTNYDLCGAGVSPSALQALTNTSFPIIESIPTFGAGDINKNKFEVRWQMGTPGAPMNAGSLLSQNLSADRYATNVFIMLQAQ
jgi:hypothetical protein